MPRFTRSLQSFSSFRLRSDIMRIRIVIEVLLPRFTAVARICSDGPPRIAGPPPSTLARGTGPQCLKFIPCKVLLMPVNTAKVEGRRKVDFKSLDESCGRCRPAQLGPVKTIGNWSPGQIFRHLAIAFNGSIDGLPSVSLVHAA